MGEEARPVGSLDTRASASPTIGSSLIPIINKLQEILAPVGDDLTGISLPEVAVVGSQSSGKSSVLEALVGHDFLPRGCNICTRRPLVLMLENRPVKPGDGGKEWGEFLHLPGKRFYDFSKIRREIHIETEREAGSNKAVSDKPIRLKICSPNVLNMTLVDLPGITKVPVGDQPSDIEARIRKMIMAHISQENCIILAVTPANSDLTNSDALQMAKEADPTGSRTIGVITKLDIMDRGTNACNFLLGNVVPLRLGYVGVVNRSQEDINKNRCIAEALSDEERFFRDHPVYSALSDRCSIPQLARKLNQILEQYIRVVLPDLKARLNSWMIIADQEVRTCGQVIEPNGKGAILLNILSKYCEVFSAMVDGNSKDLSTKELSGGARIQYIFQSIFVKSLEEVDPCDDLTDDDIQMLIQNASGLRNDLFAPEVPFEVLVRRQIGRLLSPSLQCLRYAYQELKMISRACECEVIELQRFSVLRRHLGIIMDKFLCDGTKPAEDMINNLIAMEMDYINSSHPNFLGGRKAIEQATIQQLRLPQGSMDVENASSKKSQNSHAFLARLPVTAVLPNQGNTPVTNEKPVSSDGSTSKRTWRISSIFRSKASSVESPSTRFSAEECNDLNCDPMPSEIQLREPPSILRPQEITQNDTEIVVIKLLLQSYYDIVRKNIQDLVPKAIMHFLVNHTKRELQKTFIQLLYREDLFEELLQEESDVVLKSKRSKELLQVLKQAIQMLVEVEFDISSRSSPSSFDSDAATGLPKAPGFSSRRNNNQR